ncbi:D-alanyl-D-alanine carboxypeptidase [Candidatus Gottesmanbacteria bacterium]|nr:D-alanyl-D-alanine carboxypeptidase [Candidatus Gottesmanbacteria bacterium]
MRKISLPAALFFISIILFLSAGFLFLSSSVSSNESVIISPVVSDITASNIFETDLFSKVKSQKTLDNYPPNSHFPRNTQASQNIDLDIKANSYAVMDRDTKELILGKNITTEAQIASLVKVMTAVVALEKENTEKEIVISKLASTVGEATMGLSYGESYTLSELLYGLLMVSGNDAAESIASSLGRGRNWFISEMNKKVIDLGMYDTYFVNPTGLDGNTKEESTFSTSLDLLALTDYALENETFAQIVSTKYHTITYDENYHKSIYLENLISFDATYPGIKGVKTGNTDFAGQTLISYAENNGRRIIVVILGSTGTRDDAIKIYKYLFENITNTTNKYQ